VRRQSRDEQHRRRDVRREVELCAGVDRRLLERLDRSEHADQGGVGEHVLGQRRDGGLAVDVGERLGARAGRQDPGGAVEADGRQVIEQGVLRSFLYDATTARKAKAKSTSSASRAWASLPSIGTSNFYLQAGTEKPEAIVKGVKNGLYVTAMLGRGADVVTGDYSRGANGIWIENGELAYPVQEVTVSGNLLEMLRGIDAVGDDLDFRASTASPTIRFAELVVSGA